MTLAGIAEIATRYRTAMALAMMRALAVAGFDSPGLRAALRDGGGAEPAPAPVLPAPDRAPDADVRECFANRGPSPMDWASA